MTMDPNQKIARDLDTVKELHGQLFLLLEQSVEEDPLTRASAQLDLAIRKLTKTIDTKMAIFRKEVQAARVTQTLSQGIGQAVTDFETSLAKGLTIMQECIKTRTQTLVLQRNEWRTKLKKNQHKKSGMKGYAIPRMGGNFIESDI